MNYIEGKVAQLKKRFKTKNPFEIAEQLNIEIITEPLGTIRGYYQYYKRNRYIHINEDLDSIQRKYVCGHELGHAILHPKMNIVFLQNNTYFNKDKFERQATLFCVHLLIDDDILSQYPGYTFQEIAQEEQVAVQLLQLKLSIFS